MSEEAKPAYTRGASSDPMSAWYVAKVEDELAQALKSTRFEGSQGAGVVCKDLDKAGWSRSLEAVTAETVGAFAAHSGDVRQLIADVETGALFRYVVFKASGDLSEMAAKYSAGFGELAAPHCRHKAVVLDTKNNQLISLTTWTGKEQLDIFLVRRSHPLSAPPDLMLVLPLSCGRRGLLRRTTPTSRPRRSCSRGRSRARRKRRT